MDAILKQIMGACKGGTLVVYNNHITTGVNIEDYLYELATVDDVGLNIDRQTRDMIVKLNSVIVIFLYVDPPVNGLVNFYRVIHYNYEQALDDAIDVLKKIGKL